MKALTTSGMIAALIGIAHATTYLGIKSTTSFDDPVCVFAVEDNYGCRDSVNLEQGKGCADLSGLYSVDICTGNGGVQFSPPNPSQGYPATYLTDEPGHEVWCGCYLPSNAAENPAVSCADTTC